MRNCYICGQRVKIWGESHGWDGKNFYHHRCEYGEDSETMDKDKENLGKEKPP